MRRYLLLSILAGQKGLRGSADIGQPPRWTKYDDTSDAHYFKEDVFESIENVREASSRFKTLHNGKFDGGSLVSFF